MIFLLHLIFKFYLFRFCFRRVAILLASSLPNVRDVTRRSSLRKISSWYILLKIGSLVAFLLHCFAGVSTSLSVMQRAANFPPIWAWNTSSVFRVFIFFKIQSNVKALRNALGCSFNLMVVSTRSWSFPMSAPGKMLFAFLVLVLKRCCARTKCIWFWICSLGLCQVLESAWWWEYCQTWDSGSLSLQPLSFVFPVPVPAQWWNASVS